MGTEEGDIAPETRTAPSYTSDKFAIDSPRHKSLKRTREPTPASPGNTGQTRDYSAGSVSPSKAARLTALPSQRSPSPRKSNLDTGKAGRRVHDDHTTRHDLEKELASTIMASTSVVDSHHQSALASAPVNAPTQGTERETYRENSFTCPAVAPIAAMASSSEQSKNGLRDSSAKTSMPGPTLAATSPEAMDVDDQPNNPAYTKTQPRMATTTSIANPPSQADGNAVPPPFDGTNTGTSLASTTSVASAAGSPSNHPSTPRVPQRTITHPIPGSQDTTPRSPSSGNKKHKCPFCDTEFTRHHNLKSHLLTHSQEKPYECSTCQMRFRRLHDLKRHSKLHTGEKPHICPKCDRKFARGDALARHSKGAGGCAGRRHSLPFDGDTSNFEGRSTVEGDEAMTGVQHESAAHEVDMTHSRTYPPAGARSSGLYPPNTDRSSTNNIPITAGPSQAAIASASLFAQNTVTESPKPLSPRAGALGAVRANQASNIQHQSNRRASENMTLPPSYNAPKQSSKSGGGESFVGPHGRSAAGGTTTCDTSDFRENGSLASSEKLWSHILSLEGTIKHLSDRIDTLERDHATEIAQMKNEMTALRHAGQGEGFTATSGSTASIDARS